MRSNAVIVAAAAALAVAPARGTVLTFDPHAGNGAPVNQAYGDRVAASPQGGFRYGLEFGATPGVSVSYGPLAGEVRCWDRGYGDLTNVLYRAHDGPGVLDVRLEADPGQLVTLHGFDLASFGGAGYSINRVSVLGPDGPMFVRRDVNILGAGGGVSHTSFDFRPPLRADVLIIRFDAANLGPLSERIGIDNVAFGQVPAPAGAGVLALGLAGAARRRRR